MAAAPEKLLKLFPLPPPLAKLAIALDATPHKGARRVVGPTSHPGAHPAASCRSAAGATSSRGLAASAAEGREQRMSNEQAGSVLAAPRTRRESASEGIWGKSRGNGIVKPDHCAIQRPRPREAGPNHPLRRRQPAVWLGIVCLNKGKRLRH
jgi:hypothetical protein